VKQQPQHSFTTVNSSYCYHFQFPLPVNQASFPQLLQVGRVPKTEPVKQGSSVLTQKEPERSLGPIQLFTLSLPSLFPSHFSPPGPPLYSPSFFPLLFRTPSSFPFPTPLMQLVGLVECCNYRSRSGQSLANQRFLVPFEQKKISAPVTMVCRKSVKYNKYIPCYYIQIISAFSHSALSRGIGRYNNVQLAKKELEWYSGPTKNLLLGLQLEQMPSYHLNNSVNAVVDSS